jgi:ABC-type sugar transport system ATPase subunit
VDVQNSEIVELRNISKAFGGIPVLKNVTLHLRRGVIHGLVGGNGAVIDLKICPVFITVIR